MELTHVILTRFSVRAYPDTPPFAATWLEHRLSLFDGFCAPPLAAQTCRDFAWLVFCDESTDPWCIERLRTWSSEVPRLRVVPTAPGRPAYRAALDEVRDADAALVTTRIDSDDGSSIDLVARVQEYARPFSASGQPVGLLNFSRGYKLVADDGTFHETWNAHSPHLTMLERLDGQHDPVTVQSGNHGFMQERYPLHVDAGAPMWLQVIHGGNVSNHLAPTDVEVPESAVGGRFVWRGPARLGEAVPAPQPEDPAERAAFRQALEEGLLGGEPNDRQAPGATGSSSAGRCPADRPHG